MGRVATAVRAAGYPVYYRLPSPVRRWLVRRLTPTYTVGAVVLLRDEPDSGTLLVLRQAGARGWSLPAGLLSRGEAPVDGAVRELAEETGIVLPPGRLRPAVPNAVVHTRGRWVDVVFEAAVPAADTPLRVDGAEVVEAAWYPLDALPPLTRNTAALLGIYGILPLASRRPADDLPHPAAGGAAGPGDGA